MKVAVMDIGSNTSLLLIARLEGKKKPEILEDRLFFTRLIEGFSLNEKLFSLKALKRQELFFKKATQLIKRHRVLKVLAVATAAGREAKNAQKLVLLGKQNGVSIKIISAQEEASLSRKGALFQLPLEESQVAVLDIGGGSTELSTPYELFQWPMGSVKLTESFIKNDPPQKKEILNLMEHIQKKIFLIKPKPWPKSSSTETSLLSADSLEKKTLSQHFSLVAIAGTPITLTALTKKTNCLNTLHGKSLSLKQVSFWWENLFQLSIAERKNLQYMPFYRADVMPAGVSILKQIMQDFQWENALISTTGLRHALLCQLQKQD